MSKRLAALAVCMNELGLSLGSFNDRLLTQKTVYLYQVMGVDLGYRYSWYIRGPYSPALTADAYEIERIMKIGDEHFDNAKLRPGPFKKAQKVKNLLTPPFDVELDRVRWAELLASMHFLNCIFVPPISKFDEMVARLEDEKGFTTCECDRARKVLIGAGIIPQDALQ